MPYQLHNHKVRTEVFDVEYNTKQCLISKSVGPLPFTRPPIANPQTEQYIQLKKPPHPKNMKA